MKKFLFGIVAAMVCMAVAVPVIAETKIGGMVQSDLMYISRSEERMVPGGLPNGTANFRDSIDTVEFGMPQAFNRVWWDWRSDDKKLAAMIQLRAGGFKGVGANAATDSANTLMNEAAFTWEYAWIDWHLTDNFYLRIGRQTQTFAIYHHGTVLGHNVALNGLAGFGNVTGTTSRDAIRAYIKFNDNVRMEIQALNPDNDRTGFGDFGTVNAPANIGGTAVEENVIPRMDISLPVKFGNFQIEPALTYLKQELAQVEAGADDSFDIWGASLGFKAGFGPFTVLGEVSYGENLGSSGTYVYIPGPMSAGATAGLYANTGAVRNIGTAGVPRWEDTENTNAWIDLGFNFGPFEVHGYVGYSNDQNDGSTAARDANELDVERWAYGVQVPIKIAKNFTVTPELTYYDFGGSEEYGPTSGTVDVDFGNIVVFGVGFNLTF